MYMRQREMNEARNMLVRGRETAEQIDILGDDGVPLDYHLIFMWSLRLQEFEKAEMS